MAAGIANIKVLEAVILGIRLSDVINLGDTLSVKNGAISTFIQIGSE